MKKKKNEHKTNTTDKSRYAKLQQCLKHIIAENQIGDVRRACRGKMQLVANVHIMPVNNHRQHPIKQFRYK